MQGICPDHIPAGASRGILTDALKEYVNIINILLTYKSHYITEQPLRSRPGPATMPMEQKTARLTVLIDPEKKKAFEQLCARQDITPSQVVRQMIRDYLREHGVSWSPSGSASEPR